MVMPGDNVEMVCDLHHPIAVENGQRFNIREGGRTVSYSSNHSFRKLSKFLDVAWEYRTPKAFDVAQ